MNAQRCETALVLRVIVEIKKLWAIALSCLYLLERAHIENTSTLSSVPRLMVQRAGIFGAPDIAFANRIAQWLQLEPLVKICGPETVPPPS